MMNDRLLRVQGTSTMVAFAFFILQPLWVMSLLGLNSKGKVTLTFAEWGTAVSVLKPMEYSVRIPWVVSIGKRRVGVLSWACTRMQSKNTPNANMRMKECSFMGWWIWIQEIYNLLFHWTSINTEGYSIDENISSNDCSGGFGNKIRVLHIF